MSPFLYILMAETLSIKLIFEKEAGYILGIRISRGVDPINHALFADDSLLLEGASMNISQDFFDTLLKYCLSFGALKNKAKSAVYSWNVEPLAIL